MPQGEEGVHITNLDVVPIRCFQLPDSGFLAGLLCVQWDAQAAAIVGHFGTYGEDGANVQEGFEDMRSGFAGWLPGNSGGLIDSARSALID